MISKEKFDREGTMLEMLDTMQVLMTGGGEYDRGTYHKLRSCMDQFDPQLTLAQDSAWKGMVDYWLLDTPSDQWGTTASHYYEHNITVTNFKNMPVYEPCDFASNLAYYHDVLEFCDRMSSSQPFHLPQKYVNSLGKVFSSLAMGSSFWHGSNTLLGRSQDRRILAAMAYTLHQASLAPLSSPSPILTDLSLYRRPLTSIEIVDRFVDMHMKMPVSEWLEATQELDMPDYFLTFTGIVSTVMTIGFEKETVDFLFPKLSDIFKLPDEMREFMETQYLPEIRRATEHLDIDLENRAQFLGNSFGAFSKLIYAFLWQERVLTKNNFFLDPFVNFIGWELLPRVNLIANQMTNFHHFDEEFQLGRNLYPGENWCNSKVPHAKWHVESGIGLLDLTLLVDQMFALLSGK